MKKISVLNRADLVGCAGVRACLRFEDPSSFRQRKVNFLIKEDRRPGHWLSHCRKGWVVGCNKACGQRGHCNTQDTKQEYEHSSELGPLLK